MEELWELFQSQSAHEKVEGLPNHCSGGSCTRLCSSGGQGPKFVGPLYIGSGGEVEDIEESGLSYAEVVSLREDNDARLLFEAATSMYCG
jgi:succinate dehydrogenase/fumarate reductase-like Fe-S protein